MTSSVDGWFRPAAAAAALQLLVLVMTGCEKSDATRQCANQLDGYTVAYPAEWHVNPAEFLAPCSLFDPQPIAVPRDSEVPIEIAVMVGVQPMPFEELTGDVLGRRTLSRQATTIDGRPAMRIDGETTGDGLHSPGIRSYAYFVDLGDRTLIAATHDVGPVSFERKRDVLDAIIQSATLP
jgi:hypothetical protein